MLSEAISYHDRGWRLLPLQGKRPYFELLPRVDDKPTWRPLADGASEADVRRWFDHDPDCNVGIITGDGLAVADVDRPDELEGLGFPPTPWVKTSRGYHVYLNTDGQSVKGKAFGWGEIKSEGGYVCAPPSVHPDTGQRYEWYPFLSPDDVAPADIPSTLLAVLDTQTKGAPSKDISFLGAPDKGVWSERIPELQKKAGEQRIALAVLRKCGREVQRLNKGFLCPLPGHDESHPSAALWKRPGGVIMLHDFHMVDGRKWWPLPDVYAANVTGTARQLGRGERAIWWLRALADLDEITVPKVQHHDLPGDARPSVRKLYKGFIYLLALRRIYDPTQRQAAPFSWTFAQGWCDIGSRHTVQKAMGWLFKRGYLYKRGQTPGGIGLLALGKPRPAKQKTGGADD